MNDTNKERAAFEARYASQPDVTAEPERSYELDEAGMNELIKDCIWEGWKARAAKAPAAEPVAWQCRHLTESTFWQQCSATLAEIRSSRPEKWEVRALYTAPPAPTEQWMPIETAPEDGSRLILTDGAKVFRGAFARVQFKEHRDADGNYIDQTDPDAYWLNFEDGDVCHPTHWQPEPALPAPPQGAAKGDGNG